MGYPDEKEGAWRRTWLPWRLRRRNEQRRRDDNSRLSLASSPTPTPSRYQLAERLGAGGMAEVFRAKALGAEGFERTVAIKRVLPELAQEATFVEMFVAEARTVARMSHPNIVSVLDFERAPDGQLWLVLELIDGTDLNHLLKSGPLPHAVAIFVLAEILNGLGYAHGPAVGIVHRDLSPHNILLSWDGAVKVADFGLAKPRDARQAPQGKYAFMSPEQLMGQALDGRSDLFSVGVMLWEMLTGQRLFGHGQEDERATAWRVRNQPIALPSTVRPVAPCLESVAMGLLERDVAKRYPTAEAALAALTRCEGASIQGRADLVRLLSERFPRRFPLPAVRPRPQPRPELVLSCASAPRPRRWPAVLAVTLSLCGAATVGRFVGLATRRPRSTEIRPRPTAATSPTSPTSPGSDREPPCTIGSDAPARGPCAALSPTQAPAR